MCHISQGLLGGDKSLMSANNVDPNILSGTYLFDSFSFDVARRALIKGEERFNLTRNQFQILLLLIKNAGEPVTKDQFLNQVWPDQVVEESNLVVNIHSLRRIIEADNRNPAIIVTIPGMGYKLAGDVTFKEEPPEESVVRAPPPPPGSINLRSSKRLVLTQVIGIGAALLFFGLLAFFFTPKSSQKPLIAFPLTTLQGAERYPAISPDGTLIAFTWDGDQLHNDDIYVQQTSGSRMVRVTTHPDSEIQPTWSPDGLFLAFLRRSKSQTVAYRLVLVSSLGGSEREVASVYGGLDWSPDGQQLAVTGLSSEGRSAGIQLLSLDGTNLRLVTQPDPVGNSYDSNPRFSPDGGSLGFLRNRNEFEADIFVVNLRNNEIRQITRDRKRIQDGSLYWDADGKSIFFVSTRNGNWGLSVAGLDGSKPRPSLRQVEFPRTSFNLTHKAIGYSLNHKHNLLAFTRELEDDRIEIHEAGRQDKSCLINSTRSDSAPQFSPDGSNLLFTSDRSGSRELWITNTNCTELRQLTNLATGSVNNPRWSPSGMQVAFDHQNGETSDIYVIGIDGANLQKVSPRVGNSSMPFWSHNGEWIYFTSNQAGPNLLSQIWKINPSSGTAMQVTRLDQAEKWRPQASSDGTTLYYIRNNRLWKMDLLAGVESAVPEMADIFLNCNWEVTAEGIYYYQITGALRSMIYRLDQQTWKTTLFGTIEGEMADNLQCLSIFDGGNRYAISAVYLRLSDVNLLRDWK